MIGARLSDQRNSDHAGRFKFTNQYIVYFEPRRAATGCQALIGEFETAGVIGISLVAESSTDHIEKAVCTNSAWVFSETVGGMKFKFGEEIEQQLSDR